MNQLEVIKQNVIKCTKCDLCKTRTNSVPGKGNFQSDVIFVGEAPGRNEDKNGEPFVGAAGKKLSAALEGAGISREEVYITNVVKCRPPNNRVPNTKERDTCKKYLKEEISIIKPKIICVLGNTAFNSILGGSEITKFRGKLVRKDSQLYFLTIHPAATIYNQELISTLNEDIVKLFDLIRELKNNKTVSIDIEYSS
ncbi:uracil-DNA glycosylase protein [Marine Group I thaumarchaeote SCGC AAA799-E16]|uniref:Type-4 uracil-DNA glycosylase n=4 Tax=Marine Group I TaxID=905826 RepID=A0A081RPA3_9ARCH|nr:uracil-DNA glycosylase protein [Marine Group I thaumarchaeote SCGC AAA799-N04]KER06605.1 uracil-DNA glycosylase protein [Marine Group I thaumarchaeote SCGC AAA799-E16]KFM16082.1 uracil-DNA glycosylase protein [Marine Group I thaumarchaeote SCGC AAA799-D11]KFM17819.1 uracil-DNA glycosylase protein [Marine Group I thaumarchaeote SCGC RSA3]